MNNHPERFVDMSTAAELLDIDRLKLFVLLQERGYTDPANLPASRLIDAGYFSTEARPQYNGAGELTSHYSVTLVSGKGLALLRQVIDSIKAENDRTARQTPAPLRGRDHRADEPRSPRQRLAKSA